MFYSKIIYIVFVILVIFQWSCNDIDERRKNGFIFEHKVPVYSKLQDSILNLILPVICSNVRNSFEYYVSDVIEKDDAYYVHLYPLSLLQDGWDTKTNRIQATIGTCYRIKFNSKTLKLTEVKKL